MDIYKAYENTSSILNSLENYCINKLLRISDESVSESSKAILSLVYQFQFNVAFAKYNIKGGIVANKSSYEFINWKDSSVIFNEIYDGENNDDSSIFLGLSMDLLNLISCLELNSDSIKNLIKVKEGTDIFFDLNIISQSSNHITKKLYTLTELISELFM